MIMCLNMKITYVSCFRLIKQHFGGRFVISVMCLLLCAIKTSFFELRTTLKKEEC